MSSTMNFPIHNFPNDYWRFTPSAFKSLLKIFKHSLVYSVGDKDFPHTVVGIASKTRIVLPQNFEKEIEEWQKEFKYTLITDFKNDWIIMVTPPFLRKIYQEIRNKINWKNINERTDKKDKVKFGWVLSNII